MARANGVGALLTAPGFLRLWAVGGLSNGMRQFEVLAAALFTLQATHSGFAVAAVSAARSMPMLLLGALAGCLAESVSRKTILITAQIVSGLSSLSMALLAMLGVARPWHVALAAIASGVVWSTEMATRRRMVGECVPGNLAARALAFDSVTNSFARMVGPLIAGLAYQFGGLRACFALSGTCYFAAAALALGLPHAQAVRRLILSRVPADLAEAFRFARIQPVIAGALGVTIAMNIFGFCYTGLVAPLGKEQFHVPAALVGVLASAEPLGSLLGGLLLTHGEPRVSGRVLMAGGSVLFMLVEIGVGVSPWFGLACGLLFLGGFGTAAFSNMQTALIITHAPGPIRSRLMGLLTVCIGTGPLGLLAIGGLAAWFGNRAALQVMGAAGLALLAVVSVNWRRGEARAAPVVSGRLRNPEQAT